MLFFPFLLHVYVSFSLLTIFIFNKKEICVFFFLFEFANDEKTVFL